MRVGIASLYRRTEVGDLSERYHGTRYLSDLDAMYLGGVMDLVRVRFELLSKVMLLHGIRRLFAESALLRPF